MAGIRSGACCSAGFPAGLCRLGVMNRYRHARRLADTAAQPPTWTIKSRYVPPSPWQPRRPPMLPGLAIEALVVAEALAQLILLCISLGLQVRRWSGCRPPNRLSAFERLQAAEREKAGVGDSLASSTWNDL